MERGGTLTTFKNSFKILLSMCILSSKTICRLFLLHLASLPFFLMQQKQHKIVHKKRYSKFPLCCLLVFPDFPDLQKTHFQHLSSFDVISPAFLPFILALVSCESHFICSLIAHWSIFLFQQLWKSKIYCHGKPWLQPKLQSHQTYWTL